MNEPTISWSESVAKIVPALLAAKAAMGPLIKNAQNPHLKNKYANLEATLDVVEPVLRANGVLLMQGPGGDGDSISIDTLLMHESGEWFRSVLTLKPAKQSNPQDAGSVVTYARRYSLQGIFALAAEDDDGQAATKPKAAEPTAAARRAQTQAAATNPDANALLLRAVEVGVIPSADRIMFKEWARTKVAGCGNLADNQPLTPVHIAAIEKELNKPRAVPSAAIPTDEAALKRQRVALRKSILLLCSDLGMSDDDRHAAEKKHRVLGLRDEVIGQVPLALLEELRNDLTARKEDGPLDPDDALTEYAEGRLL